MTNETNNTATENKPVKLFSNTWRYRNHMVQRENMGTDRSKNGRGNVIDWRWTVIDWEHEGNRNTRNQTYKIQGMKIKNLTDAVNYVDALIEQTSYEPTDAAIEQFNAYCEMHAE